MGARDAKLRVGMYGAGSCGGCDISLLEIGPHLLELIEAAELVFWPCVADLKYADVAGYPDNHIDVLMWNGAVRNAEHEQVARLLRRKSGTLVAFGTCACDGGIPALANLHSVEEVCEASYLDNPSLDNPEGTLPQERFETACGDLVLPRLHPQVLRLRDVVEVDYQVPGCPPQADRVWEVLQLAIEDRMPARGAAVKVGCGRKSVCDECPREKRKARIKEIKRPHLAAAEAGWCLLEQGFVCLGPATRSGCGAACLRADLGCRGCYGASGDTEDQGVSMIGALGSLLDATTEEAAQELVAQIADPLGTFYRFSLAASDLRGRR